MDQILSILQPWYLAIVSFLGFVILRVVLYRFLKKVIYHISNEFDIQLINDLLTSFEKPLYWQLYILAFYFFFINSPLHVHSDRLLAFIEHVLRSSVVFCLFWGVYNISNSTNACMLAALKNAGIEMLPSNNHVDLTDKNSTLSRILSSLIHFVILLLGFVTIAEEWDYDITGFIASLSIGSLAVALAAKDLLANIFGGLIIIIDKPFYLGDWIVTNNLEGVVEKVTLRSTCIRTFNQERIYLPNSLLANAPIKNYSVRTRRRFIFNMTLEYGTPRAKMEEFMQATRDLLTGKSFIDPDTVQVNFLNYNASSLDIQVIGYTLLNEGKINVQEHTYRGYLNEINLDLMDVIKKVGVSCAFPSTSVYFGNELHTTVAEPNEPAAATQNTTPSKS